MQVIDFHERYGPKEDQTSDTDWLAECARQGWFVITQDVAIVRRAHERYTVEKKGIGFFAVGAASKPRTVVIERILEVRTRIEEIARTEPVPFLFHIFPGRRVERKASKARANIY